jgi:4-hydroxybenzoate polyprenyltransferase
MSSLAALYLSIAVGVSAVVAVVAFHSAPAGVASGLIVMVALGVAVRAVLRLARDGDEPVGPDEHHGLRAPGRLFGARRKPGALPARK